MVFFKELTWNKILKSVAGVLLFIAFNFMVIQPLIQQAYGGYIAIISFLILIFTEDIAKLLLNLTRGYFLNENQIIIIISTINSVALFQVVSSYYENSFLANINGWIFLAGALAFYFYADNLAKTLAGYKPLNGASKIR